MMGLGWQELLIVLVIIIIIFGAGKLPEFGTGLGRGVKEFKEAKDDDPDAPIASTTSRKPSGKAAETRELRADQI